MRFQSVFIAVALGLILALVVSCAPQPAEPTVQGQQPPSETPAALDKVTVMLDWVPNTNHTGLYAALDRGYYKERGLDVEIVQPAEGGVGQLVAMGKAEFGLSHQEEVTHARAQNVPVVSIAAVMQHNASGFASPKDKGITRPKDFEGRSYGGFGSPIEKQVLEVLMKADGGDVNKVEFINIGSNDFFIATQRDVDFAWIFDTWTGVEAQIRGVELNYVALRDWPQALPDYYTPVLIAGEQTIEQNPDLVRRFVEATSEGYEFAIDNPAEAAAILIKHAPESNAELVKRSQAVISPLYAEDAPRWGEQKLEVWQSYGDWMAEQGVLDKKIDATKAFTNEFLPEAE